MSLVISAGNNFYVKRNYSVVEKDGLALITAVKTFEQYLYGKKATVLIDHKPLQFLHNIANTNARLARWNLFLHKFDWQPLYRQGLLIKKC
jgi:hypothetical protein